MQCPVKLEVGGTNETTTFSFDMDPGTLTMYQDLYAENLSV